MERTRTKPRSRKIRLSRIAPYGKYNHARMANGLTYQQEIFCQAYVHHTDFNGTLAAVEAGYSKKTATQAASQLLTNFNIKSRVTELTEDRARRLQVSTERIVEELSKGAFLKPDESGARWSDKNKSLEMLGNYRRMFPDTLNVNMQAVHAFNFEKITPETVNALREFIRAQKGLDTSTPTK